MEEDDMARKEDVQKLVGRAMSDEKFRNELAEHPGNAAKSMGVTLSPEDERIIKQNARAFMDAGAELDKVAGGATGHVSHIEGATKP